MSLFKRKRKTAAPARLAVKLAGRAELLQTRVADYLNGRTADLSARGKWVFLAAVCLLFGGFSLYLLIKAFM